jgi:hypothetical protein
VVQRFCKLLQARALGRVDLFGEAFSVSRNTSAQLVRSLRKGKKVDPMRVDVDVCAAALLLHLCRCTPIFPTSTYRTLVDACAPAQVSDSSERSAVLSVFRAVVDSMDSRCVVLSCVEFVEFFFWFFGYGKQGLGYGFILRKCTSLYIAVWEASCLLLFFLFFLTSLCLCVCVCVCVSHVTQLHEILHLLHELCASTGQLKMTSRKVAHTFGRVLVRPADEAISMRSLAKSAKRRDLILPECHVVELAIELAYQIFPTPLEGECVNE